MNDLGWGYFIGYWGLRQMRGGGCDPAPSRTPSGGGNIRFPLLPLPRVDRASGVSQTERSEGPRVPQS